MASIPTPPLPSAVSPTATRPRQQTRAGGFGLWPRLALAATALLAGALFAATLLLWSRHGTSVFFATLQAGIVGCL